MHSSIKYGSGLWLMVTLVFLFVSAIYLFAFPQPNVFYAAIVLLHVVGGLVAALLVFPVLRRSLRAGMSLRLIAWLLLAAGAFVGIALIYTGTPRHDWNWLYLHLVLCTAAVGILLAVWAGKRGWLGAGAVPTAARLAIGFALLASIGSLCWYLRTARWQTSAVIANPPDSPAAMEGEGDGPRGPFFPSSAQVYGGQKIPSKFFMESDSCKRCHQDIYNEWYSSTHHFSSFNNQWYRKSIEYMQDT